MFGKITSRFALVALALTSSLAFAFADEQGLPTSLIPDREYESVCHITIDGKDASLADLFLQGRFETYYFACYGQYLIELIIYLGGGISILFVIIGGYKYIVGSVSDNKEAGKKTIAYALAGFAVSVLAWAVVNFVQVWLTSG
ncbi:MAG: pilin [Patescibacteria group bacterium]